MLKASALPTIPLKLIPSLLAIEKKIPLTFKENLIKVVPKILQPSLRLVPFNAQKSLLLPALTNIFSEAIEDGDFEFLQDKWLKISITDLQLNWWLSFDKDQLIMASSKDNITEDVSFSANGDDLVLIAGRKQDPDTLFFQRRLKIEGDTELGLEVKNLIDAVDIKKMPYLLHSITEIYASLLQNIKDERAFLKVKSNKNH